MERSALPAYPYPRRFLDRLTSGVATFATDHPWLFVFTVAFLARAAIAVSVEHIFGGALISGDSLGYHNMAQVVVEGKTAAWDDFTYGLYERTVTFLVPLTWLYRIFGPSFALGGTFVAILGALTAVITMRLCAKELEPRWCLFAGLIVALLPSQVLWSSVPLKDPAVWLIVAVTALLFAIATQKTPRKLWLPGLGIAAAVLGLAYLRPNTLVVTSFALMLSSWVGNTSGRMARIVGALAIGIGIPWAVGFGPAGWNLITGSDPANMRTLNAIGAQSAVVAPPAVPAEEPSPIPILPRFAEVPTAEKVAVIEDAIVRKQQRAAVLEEEAEELPQPEKRARLRERAADLRAEAAVLVNEAERWEAFLATQDEQPTVGEEKGMLDPNLRHLPRGLSVVLLEPFPWQSGESTSLNLARLEMLIWYPIVLLALLGILSVFRYPRVLLFPLLVGGATVIVYALTEGNLGTAHRHRGEFVWAVALFAAFGAARVARWRSNRAAPSR